MDYQKIGLKSSTANSPFAKVGTGLLQTTYPVYRKMYLQISISARNAAIVTLTLLVGLTK